MAEDINVKFKKHDDFFQLIIAISYNNVKGTDINYQDYLNELLEITKVNG